MTLEQLMLEIKVGDVINQKYTVTNCNFSVITTKADDELCKFTIYGKTDMYGRIETVARDGVTYFTRLGRGGYRHGKKKDFVRFVKQF
jgi:hypothetical protein